MYPAVKTVSANKNFTLSITFDNGESGILNMKPILDFGVFNRLKDIDEFMRVKVSFDTVEWEPGLDIDPEFVYRNCDNLAQIK